MGFNYIKYSDDDTDPEAVRAIENIDLKIEAGQFIAILGHNGSGKSTLAKHINALLQPTSGTMWIDGVDTSEEEDLWKVRQKAGMVFQNPDNQIIGTVVEEERRLRSGKSRNQDGRYLEAGRGQPDESRDARFPRKIPEPAVGRAEAARRDCGRRCHAS